MNSEYWQRKLDEAKIARQRAAKEFSRNSGNVIKDISRLDEWTPQGLEERHGWAVEDFETFIAAWRTERLVRERLEEALADEAEARQVAIELELEERAYA